MAEQQETGECWCGAQADYYGPDPYRSEMCDAYAGRPRGCAAGCTCWEEVWICDDCYRQACEDL